VRHLKRYLDLQQAKAAIAAPPANGLGLIIVVPCLREPAMLELLDHLRSRETLRCAVEVIVVINHPAGAPDAVRTANMNTLKRICAWKQARKSADFRVYPLRAFDLPPKSAGVGLARKIGMDEAMRRFAAIARPNGIIASLDADCRVSRHYLTALHRAFDDNPAMHAATLAWAHPFDEIADPRHRYAMICYELFLRYIEQGWRQAGLPYAFTAIGSCFAVRANACARHHGMNRRKAGEDFYFLHKLAREKPLGRISQACVYPSARMRGRTPFGTARAVTDWYRSGSSEWPVRPPQCFSDLRRMHDSLPDLYAGPTARWLGRLPPPLAAFLDAAGLGRAAEGMRAHAASADTFEKRYYVWFDGLKAWRYVRQASTHIPVEAAAAALLAMDGITPAATDAESLLLQYRRL